MPGGFFSSKASLSLARGDLIVRARSLRARFASIRALLSRRPHCDLDDELRFHIDQATQCYIVAGLAPAEAHRRARIDFGGIEHAREESARQHPRWLLGTIAQDVHYALRGFRRNPLFALTVVATLALSIGATTAVFSVVDRILFRALPYAHADRLVSLGMKHAVEPYEFMMGSFFYDWQDRQTPFTAMTAQSAMPQPCDLTERNPVRLTCNEAHRDLLPTLGVAPLLGHNFLAGDMLPNAPRTVLLSYGLWCSRYNRDPGVLNQLIQIDGGPARVIGILPRDFEMPAMQAADVLLPKQIDVTAVRSGTAGETMRAFARLKPGVTLAQARAAMEPLFRDSVKQAPAPIRNDMHFEIRSLRDRQILDAGRVAWLLLGSAIAVLLIACANVGSLFVTRGATRERELAVRAALGATRGRLVRQTLTESLLLSLAGGLFGCIIAAALLRLFLAIAPPGIPYVERSSLDLRILFVALALSLAAGLFCGILPARQRPRTSALTARVAGAGTHATLRRALVVAQIACSVLLLTGAALLLRSFRNMEDQTFGIATKGVLTADVSLTWSRYSTPQKQMDFFTRAATSLRSLPGVSAVAFADSIPLGGHRQNRWYSEINVAGKPASATANGGIVAARAVTPGYFRALDIPIVLGRGFTPADADAKDHPIVLNRLLADRLFPGEDPIGQRLRLFPGDLYHLVIGVAANVRNGGLAGADLPEYDVLLRNIPEDWSINGHGTLIVQSALPAAAIAPGVRQQIAAIDPTTPVDIQTLDQQISTLADRPRFETALLGFFALTGLVMAVIGLYGVTAYAAAQRTHEIGVRMALGATRSNILRLVSWEGVRLVLGGASLGLGAALAASQCLSSMLYGIGPRDPLTFIGVALLLGCVAMAATLIPAASATRVNPVTALRRE